MTTSQQQAIAHTRVWMILSTSYSTMLTIITFQRHLHRVIDQQVIQQSQSNQVHRLRRREVTSVSSLTTNCTLWHLTCTIRDKCLICHLPLHQPVTVWHLANILIQEHPRWHLQPNCQCTFMSCHLLLEKDYATCSMPMDPGDNWEASTWASTKRNWLSSLTLCTEVHLPQMIF